MKELLAALLLWTGQATGYPPLTELPQVERIDAAELQEIFATGGAHAVAEESGQQVAALYEPARHVISIDEELDLASPLGRSYLVHELVHALQFAHGRQMEVNCLGMLEAEAYGAQARYLRGEGAKQEATLHMILGLMQAGCSSPS
jgi:hypothetical protein